ncbi:MAG: redoxin domain-containing protein [Bacteroidales bacterium]|jgi:peroxiredoxin|nr:redoxin domain-containing protein [Bacteroidales bacterium]
MKRLAVMMIACLISMAGFAQGYVINAQVKDVSGGSATLRLYFKDGNERLDSTVIDEKGQFSFRGEVKEPIPALLTINGKRNYRIYIENATYSLMIDPSSLAKSKFKGSKLTDKWYELTSAKENEDYNVHLERLEKWVLNNPDDIFSPDLIASYLSYQWDYNELNRTLNTLQRNARETYFYIHLQKRVEALKRVEIGQKAPDFALNNPKGQRITLYDCLRGKKYLLIDFWASWCKPCRMENPNVVATYERYNSFGFGILGVSLDKDKAAWEKAISDDHLVWEQVSDLKFWQSEVAQLYMINSIPSNVLLDEKGIIIARNLRGEELMNKLAELTAEQGYHIEGTIEGVKEGIVKMELLLEGGQKKVVTTDVNHGKFIFNGVVDKVCMANIVLPSKNGEFSFFLENSKINIQGDKTKLEHIKINGSKSNDAFSQIANRCNADKNPMQCLMNEVLTNPTSVYAPLIISSYLAPYLNIADLQALVAKLDGEAKTMYQYKLLQDHIINEKSTETIGEKAPDFSLANVKGNDIRLSDFVKGKRYVILDFWASDVSVCAVEAKTLATAYRNYKSKGLDIISVSLDANREAWLKGINEQARKWENVSDLNRWNTAVVKLYKLDSLPQNVIIDSEGMIVARNVRGNELLNLLQQLFTK